MLRSSYWILKGRAAMRNELRNCSHCRRLKAPTCEQRKWRTKKTNIEAGDVDEDDPPPPSPARILQLTCGLGVSQGRDVLRSYHIYGSRLNNDPDQEDEEDADQEEGSMGEEEDATDMEIEIYSQLFHYIEIFMLPRKQVLDPMMLGFADARKGQHKRSQKDNGSSCPLFKPHQEEDY
ncbi:hypothetical protein CAPTEDRAFT_189424 [Capitella teleta]|uniref:Uncharacterized protein n=1 Tax=Capitella teleta TaxID=283909 RepID=R7VIL7_CAPTE|nr:hypothetical protein CAPTEDRAFT_189424 [Capitella teleta]|eukprot:ELU15560.1 hypothetical protein CAPTEDRAFT_189424 [Capitella teleta]